MSTIDYYYTTIASADYDNIRVSDVTTVLVLLVYYYKFKEDDLDLKWLQSRLLDVNENGF